MSGPAPVDTRPAADPDAAGGLRPGRVLASTGAGAGAIAAAVYLYLVDPHDGSAAMPACPTRLVTGMDCPACGGLRAAHDLLHGDPVAALGHNLFLPLAALVLAVPVGASLLAWLRGRSRPLPRTLVAAVLVAAVVFVVVRNLPGSPLAAG